MRKTFATILASMPLLLVLMLLPDDAARATVTTERLFYPVKALTVVSQDSLCYLVPAHDTLVARQHADLDTIARLMDQIRVLEADIVVLKHELRIAHLNTEEAQTRTEIAEVKRGGFWQRNFGRCFWTGAVAGAAGWELMDRE